MCLAPKTEKAGPAVPSGGEQGSTETQKRLEEKDILQWLVLTHDECEEDGMMLMIVIFRYVDKIFKSRCGKQATNMKIWALSENKPAWV